MKKIPFNKPYLSGRELDYIRDAVESGQISGDGPYTRKCHSFLEKYLGAERVLLTTSCTHALEMAALLLELNEGEEVIVPSFTFVSTVNAFVLHGGRPVFADIRPDTLNLDETQIERLIGPRTRAIVPVHYAGVGCEMDDICRIAEEHNLIIVEDNAHGLFGTYRNRALGRFGALATQSFHETKNISCGEGGALIINDPRYIERAEIIREKGTNRSQFFRGQVDKYSWIDVGSSYLPSDVLAAYLWAQLESWQDIQARRQAIWEHYNRALADWAAAMDIRLPFIPDHCSQPFHMYYLILPSLNLRQRLIGHLRERDIHSVFHYLPLHNSKFGSRFRDKRTHCPVTEDISKRLLRLPFFNELTEADIERIVTAILDFSG